MKFSKKVKFSINPDPSIRFIASVGDDNYIHLWNYEEKKIKKSKYEKNTPTFCRFNNKGDKLCVGYENGDVFLYTFDPQNKETHFQ